MSLQWQVPEVYVDGDFTVPVPVGIPEFSSPVPATTEEYIFTQKFQQYRANFAPAPLNSPHPSAGMTPDYSNYFLIEEGRRQDLGFGVVEWKRTYGVKPASHSEGETANYQFIGFVGVWLSTSSSGFVNNVSPGIVSTVTGRPRKSYSVPSRVQYDYFLVAGIAYQGAWSNAGVYTRGQSVSDVGVYYACSSAVGPTATHPAADPSHWTVIAAPDYSAETAIPMVFAQRYFASGGTLSNGILTDFLTDGVGGLAATSPTLTTYSTWMANAAANGWACGIAPGGGTPGQIIAEDSRVSRWNGNIWVRATRYVLAQ